MTVDTSSNSGYVDRLTPEQERNLVVLTKGLPSLLSSNSFAQNDFLLWGVDLSSLSSEGAVASRKQNVILLKFLRARSFDVEKASTMLIDCLKWRKDFKVANLDTEDHPSYLKKCGIVAGRDKHGNPVTYNFYGGMDMQEVFGGTDGPEKFIRWRIWLMEAAIKALDFESGIEHVMQVHDYDGASLRRDAVVKASTQKIIKLFQDYYPEFLPAKLFVNVPKVMEVMYGLFSAFSDPATRAKFNMVGHGRTRYTLLQHLDVVQLPTRYGGFLDLGVESTEASKFTVRSGERIEIRKVISETEDESSREGSKPRANAPKKIQWAVCSDWSDMTVKATEMETGTGIEAEAEADVSRNALAWTVM
eukprot:CAMPEP_0175086368 /NCGR_PEP_ID=MMETSP0052_2-20121109/29210_1 /TAXON_ID=51329 ORGANISM="Polytomella parva, Strain SAG 63-3" /NCGR_SAMPLE_ID=MMETSP0052_2 /ASSEMBLY_ACC=CAM_ASM_000194 /LENGTH=360 /DNA_ID=CAMNT_0016358543 /DNA_START=151 /DNA_END=1232 /DNA_ORIENTATION=+